jgi:hypothetical protein
MPGAARLHRLSDRRPSQPSSPGSRSEVQRGHGSRVS